MSVRLEQYVIRRVKQLKKEGFSVQDVAVRMYAAAGRTQEVMLCVIENYK
jgi:hypothetical protein